TVGAQGARRRRRFGSGRGRFGAAERRAAATPRECARAPRRGESRCPGAERCAPPRSRGSAGAPADRARRRPQPPLLEPPRRPAAAVETDYLRGIAPRGPEMPGYSLGAFFFRDDETPMGESTYETRTPAPPEIDAHNVQLPQGALTRDADGFRFRYSARDVKPL